jgi:hypothetical protein
MKIKDLKFENIAYYVDNVIPVFKSKLKQLDESAIVVQNPKRFLFLSINILLLFIYCYLMLFMNYSLSCSMITNIVASIFFLLMTVYFNSKILYALNNREKIIDDVEIKENKIKEFKFNSSLVDRIKKVKSDLNLNGKTDLAILFLYVQHFVLKQRISNSEILRKFNNSIEFEQFSDTHYSDISNDLFEWKNDNSKIRNVKNVLNGSKYYEKFKDIEDNFKEFIS